MCLNTHVRVAGRWWCGGALPTRQVIGYLESVDSVRCETAASAAALLAALPSKLSRDEKLQLLDLRPQSRVVLEVVRAT